LGEKKIEMLHACIESAAREGKHSTDYVEVFEDGPSAFFKNVRQKIWSGEVVGISDPNNLLGPARVVYETLVDGGYAGAFYYGRFKVSW
jgi:hypothetical protein